MFDYSFNLNGGVEYKKYIVALRARMFDIGTVKMQM
jgi:hypothetical protein